jgi:transcriptional regulator with XRE-family HTH domain
LVLNVEHGWDPTWLREARTKARLTQSYVAAAVGVSEPTVNRWETGERTPRFEHVCALTVVLNTPYTIIGTPRGTRRTNPPPSQKDSP